MHSADGLYGCRTAYRRRKHCCEKSEVESSYRLATLQINRCTRLLTSLLGMPAPLLMLVFVLLLLLLLLSLPLPLLLGLVLLLALLDRAAGRPGGRTQ